MKSKSMSESIARSAALELVSDPSAVGIEKSHTEDSSVVEEVKKKVQERRLKATRALADRIRVAPDGTREFVRFSRAQCLEHYVLMAAFGTLAITGLLQLVSNTLLGGWIIQILGGVETLRTAHHLAAVVLAVQSVYHVWQILVQWFVKRERGGMWPYLRDFLALFQTMLFNIGIIKKKPQADRFSIEEKLEYWALLWGTVVMGITGLILWFPVVATYILPGQIVAISRAIHGREALLAVLAILTWHMYHTNIKEKNRSIFTGVMSEEEMAHAHPLEYRRILAADEYLKKHSN